MSRSAYADWRWWVGLVIGGAFVGLFAHMNWPVGFVAGSMFAAGYNLGRSRDD